MIEKTIQLPYQCCWDVNVGWTSGASKRIAFDSTPLSVILATLAMCWLHYGTYSGACFGKKLWSARCLATWKQTSAGSFRHLEALRCCVRYKCFLTCQFIAIFFLRYVADAGSWFPRLVTWTLNSFYHLSPASVCSDSFSLFSFMFTHYLKQVVCKRSAAHMRKVWEYNVSKNHSIVSLWRSECWLKQRCIETECIRFKIALCDSCNTWAVVIASWYLRKLWENLWSTRLTGKQE